MADNYDLPRPKANMLLGRCVVLGNGSQMASVTGAKLFTYCMAFGLKTESLAFHSRDAIFDCLFAGFGTKVKV